MATKPLTSKEKQDKFVDQQQAQGNQLCRIYLPVVLINQAKQGGLTKQEAIKQTFIKGLEADKLDKIERLVNKYRLLGNEALASPKHKAKELKYLPSWRTADSLLSELKAILNNQGD